MLNNKEKRFQEKKEVIKMFGTGLRHLLKH